MFVCFLGFFLYYQISMDSILFMFRKELFSSFKKTNNKRNPLLVNQHTLVKHMDGVWPWWTFGHGDSVTNVTKPSARHTQSASLSACFWDADKLADWLTDSPSGTLGLLPLKCWNLRFFIVVWKGSLPLTQEAEWLPCSKNARFPGPIPRVPIPCWSQNISNFRNQGHCIFILILFFASTVPGS